MRGRADLKAWTSDVFRKRRRGESASRRELIRAGLLGGVVLLVMGIELGRWFLAG
jgi:hypothetical protein